MIEQQIIETTEVRRHNGQCEYGDWLPLAEAPASVIEEVTCEVAEIVFADIRRESRRTNTDESGMVMVGGQRWVYRR